MRQNTYGRMLPHWQQLALSRQQDMQQPLMANSSLHQIRNNRLGAALSAVPG